MDYLKDPVARLTQRFSLRIKRKLYRQAAQKISKARRAKFDELRRTLQYVEAKSFERNEAYESFQQSATYSGFTPVISAYEKLPFTCA